MKLSRKWLNEYVDLPLTEIDDRTFAEAMTVSGSKVETTDDLSKCIKNVAIYVFICPFLFDRRIDHL